MVLFPMCVYSNPHNGHTDTTAVSGLQRISQTKNSRTKVMLLNHSSYNRKEKCLSVRSFKRSMKILPDVCTGLYL